MINLVDGTICFLVIPIMLSSFCGGEAVLFAHSQVCYVWAVLWEILIRMSIFLISVMSIARTVALVNPLHAPRRIHLVLPVVVYLVVLVVQESIPLVLEAQSEYHEIFATCGLDVKEVIGHSVAHVKIYFFFTIDLEFITPLVIIIISSIVSVVQLMKGASQHNKYKHDEATKTILILAMVYIVLNIPYCAMYLLESIFIWSDGEIMLLNMDMSPSLRNFVYSFILTHTMALNSMINPLVYFCRLTQLRDFVMKKDGLRNSISKSFKSGSKMVRSSPLWHHISGIYHCIY